MPSDGDHASLAAASSSAAIDARPLRDDVSSPPSSAPPAPPAPSAAVAAALAVDASPATAHFRAYVVRDPWLASHKAVYFIAMGSAAAYYPYLVLYLIERLGLSDFEAGALLAISHTLAMLLAPPLTALADRGARWRRGVLLASLASTVVLVALMSTASSYGAVLVAATAVDAGMCAVWPKIGRAHV